MYKLFFVLIAGILTISTIFISAFQPTMHKTLFVYNSDYKIVEQKPVVETVKTLPTKVNEPQVQKVVQKVDKNIKTTPKTTVVKKVEIPVVKKEVSPKTSELQTKVETTSNPLLSMLKETKQEKVLETQKTQTQEQKPKTVVKTVSEEEKARQEVILWNEWRSNLQNKIMSDVKLPIMPEGTIFKFTFEVDKYGKISNVQTWSLTPAYTPYAIQYIAPVIRSYQGRDILRFPEGSNRISTMVEGGWKISQTAKFSTPNDYQDSEKIINKD